MCPLRHFFEATTPRSDKLWARIHTGCYEAIKDCPLPTLCHRCKAATSKALPDREFERCMNVIAHICQTILQERPHIDNSSLEKRILFEAISANEKGVVRILVAADDAVPPELLEEVVDLLFDPYHEPDQEASTDCYTACWQHVREFCSKRFGMNLK